MERHDALRRPGPDLQSNFRMSSNSDGVNCRPAALVTWTRHPDLKSMRALATVSVGLVICTIAVSPSLEDEIVKPTFLAEIGRTSTEPAMRGASGMPSKCLSGFWPEAVQAAAQGSAPALAARTPRRRRKSPAQRNYATWIA